jgi:hypothetical protein
MLPCIPKRTKCPRCRMSAPNKYVIWRDWCTRRTRSYHDLFITASKQHTRAPFKLTQAFHKHPPRYYNLLQPGFSKGWLLRSTIVARFAIPGLGWTLLPISGWICGLYVHELQVIPCMRHERTKTTRPSSNLSGSEC